MTFKGDGPLAGLQVIADASGTVKGKVGNPAADPPLRPDGKLNVGQAVGRGEARPRGGRVVGQLSSALLPVAEPSSSRQRAPAAAGACLRCCCQLCRRQASMEAEAGGLAASQRLVPASPRPAWPGRPPSACRRAGGGAQPALHQPRLRDAVHGNGAHPLRQAEQLLLPLAAAPGDGAGAAAAGRLAGRFCPLLLPLCCRRFSLLRLSWAQLATPHLPRPS